MPVRSIHLTTHGGDIVAPIPGPVTVLWIGPGLDELGEPMTTPRLWRSHAADHGEHNSRATHARHTSESPIRRRRSSPGRVIRPDLARRGYELRGTLGPKQVHLAHGSVSDEPAERPRADGGETDLRPERPRRRGVTNAGTRPHHAGVQLRSGAHRRARNVLYW